MLENNPFIKSLEVIWKNPKYVFINEDKLEFWAANLAQEKLDIPDWQIKFVLPKASDERFVEFIGWTTSVNFCFTNFFPPYKKYTIEFPKNKIWTGSMALSAVFMRNFGNTDFYLTNFMRNLTFNQARKIFQGIHPLPLLEERVGILREIGENLSKFFDGKFINLFEEGNWEFKKIVYLLVEKFPSFRDESFHIPSGTFLKFYKRAQLINLIYQGRALNSNRKLPLLKDANDIGPIADYQVPKALHYLGILNYHPKLEKEIQTRMIIPKDSLKEQELRAQMSLAMIKLLEKINKRRKAKNQINMIALDYKIWSLGKKCKKLHHHLTPTIAY